MLACLRLPIGFALAVTLLMTPALAVSIVIDAALDGNPPEFTIDSGRWIEELNAGKGLDFVRGFDKDLLTSYNNDVEEQGETASVSWVFEGLDVDSTYDVAATWAIGPSNRSTDSLFTVIGDTTVGPTNVNQSIAPKGDYLVEDSFEWLFSFQTLASIKPNSEGVITLTLTDPIAGADPDGFLKYSRADAALVDPVVLGDYNNDDVVNAADYTLWRDTLGSEDDLRANGDDTGNSEGIIDAADYVFWKDNYGAGGSGASLSASNAVPEPSSLALIALGLTALAGLRRRA